MKAKIIQVIDGDTFKITPKWKAFNKTGSFIRPTGYNTPERGKVGFIETRSKATKLLLNKKIEIKNPIKMDRARLLCDVYFKGKELRYYF